MTFSPSDVLMNLLFCNLEKELPELVYSQITRFVTEQLSVGLTCSLRAIRFRYALVDLDPEENTVWLVNKDRQIRSEVFLYLRKSIELNPKVDFFNVEFTRRLGEEMWVWFFRNEIDARTFGLTIDKMKRLAIVRENEVHLGFA